MKYNYCKSILKLNHSLIYNKIILISYILILLLSACNNSSESIDEQAKVDSFKIPKNAIPIINNGYVLVQGMLDSLQGSFLIDMGSGWLLVDSIFQSKNHSKKYNYYNSKITGIGNSFQYITVIKDSVNFSIGNISYRTSDISVIKMKPIGGDLIDGLIGTDFFAKRVLEINYAKEFIRIYKDIDSIDISGYKFLPMIMIDNYFCVPLTIKINDSLTIKGNFIIDTGMPMSTITSSVAKKKKFDKKIGRKILFYTEYGGIGGESSGYDFIADSLQISDYCFKNVVMSFSLDEAGALSKDKYLGIIGNDVLEHFDVIFDFINSNLYLKPNENYNSPFILDKFGFFYVDRCKTMGAWIVTGLFENTAAEKQGLKIDDKIISINDIPVEKTTYKDQKYIFPKLDKVKLGIKRAEGIKILELKLPPLL